MEPLDGLDFSQALNRIKEGKNVRRTGWNGPDQYLFAVWDGTTSNHGTGKFDPFVAIRNQQGGIVPWLASQGDMFATDWEVLTP